MELILLLAIIAGFVTNVGKAIGWCLVALTRGICLLLIASIRSINTTKIDRSEPRRQEQSPVVNTTVNPNMEDAVSGLKRMGLPEKTATTVVKKAAEFLGPTASAERLIKVSLQSLDRG